MEEKGWTCARLSEPVHGLHSESAFISQIAHQDAICCGDSRYELGTMRFYGSGALELANTNNFTLNFTFLVDGHTEMMWQLHALQSHRIYECVTMWIGVIKKINVKKKRIC